MKSKPVHATPGARSDPPDPCDIFVCQRTYEDRKAVRLALSSALSFHFILFLLRFNGADPYLSSRIQPLASLTPILKLGDAAPGGPAERTKMIERNFRTVKPKLPVPDPTPDEPEPLFEIVPDPIPAVISEINAALQAGEAVAPTGSGDPGKENRGRGSGASEEPGILTELSGPGDTLPSPILRPLPYYTEEARKARIEGIVLVQCVVRKDGSVDTLRVMSGLGHGLDESALNTLATKWRFRPGTRNGRPVDVQIYVEVLFRLF